MTCTASSYAYLIYGLGRPFLPAEPAPPDDLDGQGGVRESQPGGHGGDLQDAALIAAVSALTGLAGYRDLPPGQACELSEQAGLGRELLPTSSLSTLAEKESADSPYHAHSLCAHMTRHRSSLYELCCVRSQGR